MAVDEKNPGRWELVKVYRTLPCWLVVSEHFRQLNAILRRITRIIAHTSQTHPSTQDEYAAVYIVSYGNGRTKLCAQEDLCSLDSLLRTNAQTSLSACYRMSKQRRDGN